MGKLIKYAEYFMMAEFMKAKIAIFQKENGREGVDFIFKTKSRIYHELYLQSIELGQQRSVKIPKQQLGKLKDNLWIALVLLLEGEELGLFLIPSKTFETPDNYIFIDNPQSERFAHLANWETKVFKDGMDKLNEYQFVNQVKNLI